LVGAEAEHIALAVQVQPAVPRQPYRYAGCRAERVAGAARHGNVAAYGNGITLVVAAGAYEAQGVVPFVCVGHDNVVRFRYGYGKGRNAALPGHGNCFRAYIGGNGGVARVYWLPLPRNGVAGSDGCDGVVGIVSGYRQPRSAE